MFPCGRDAARAPTIALLREMARRRLPRFAFDYLEGGAGAGRTLVRNRAALEAITLLPRALRDVAQVDTTTTLLGLKMAAPVMVAPTGVAGLMRPGADAMLARAAAVAGLPFVLSAASNMPVEEVAKAIDKIGGQLWMQLYPLRDRAAAGQLAARAQAAGFVGVVVTVDAAVHGARHWERLHFTAAGRPRLRTRLDALCHPAWLAGTLRHGEPRFPNIVMDMPESARTSQAERNAINEGKDSAFTFDSLAQFRDAWKGRLVVKGLQALDDVAAVARLGVDAVVLSNHGGRQLDSAAAPIETLAACKAVAGAMPVLVDSGFRDGGDIAKAIALGAAAVLVGRAPLYGVTAGGEAGAARALEILVSDLRRVMALLGCASVSALGPEHILPGR